MFGLRSIIRLFEDGNVAVVGLRGRGKDMLLANVIMRRKLDYCSNVNYGGRRFSFIPRLLNCGENTYREFITGNLNRYEFPYPDGTDIYVSDAGVYFPSQYCNELNRDFKFFPVFMALSRHLGDCNLHFNVQNLNRCWDKIREQCDHYILCNRCKVIFGIVFQQVTIYEKYQSAVDRVPVFPLRRPLFNLNRIQMYDLAKANYLISHGKIQTKLLIYRNRSNYDTRIFKKILEEGAAT